MTLKDKAADAWPPERVPGRPPDTLTEAELAWLAGWLEGEGCFTCQPPRPRTGHGWRVFVSGASTDQDVIARVVALAGGGVRWRPPAEKHHQECWLWSLERRADALALVRALLPYMGKRRATRIREMLATPEPKTAEEKYAHIRKPCGTVAAYGRGCRCDACREANTKRCREYREGRGVAA